MHTFDRDEFISDCIQGNHTEMPNRNTAFNHILAMYVQAVLYKTVNNNVVITVSNTRRLFLRYLHRINTS